MSYTQTHVHNVHQVNKDTEVILAHDTTHIPEWNGSHCVLQLHSWDALVHTHNLGTGGDVTRHHEVSHDASCDLPVSTSRRMFAVFPGPTHPKQAKQRMLNRQMK